MLEIKDRDILKFIDGELTKGDVKESIDQWLKADDENLSDVQLMKTVVNESAGLKDINPVDVDAEWAFFTANIKNENPEAVVSEPSERDLLLYLDKVLPPNKRQGVESWASSDIGNSSVIADFNTILDHAPATQSYKLVDSDAEWLSFTSARDARSVDTKIVSMSDPVVPTSNRAAPTVTSSAEERSTIIPIWMRYASAAAVALLCGFFLWQNMGNNKVTYSTYATKFNTHDFQMVDGSYVTLGENTTLKYPTNIKGADERKLYIDGEGQFDVASIKEKPFIVEVTNEIAVEVTGTIFKVFRHEDFAEAVENIEGSVRAYSIKNPEIYVDMTAGDRYGWDGEKFIDLNIPAEVDNSVEYNILYVLDYLMANSAWRVVSSPNMPFDEEGVVKIDLDQPIEDVLSDLQKRADFDYFELDCDNCYQISRFQEKSY